MRKRRDLGQPSDIAFLLIIFFLLLAGINTTQSIVLHTSRSAAEEEAVLLQALLTQQGTVVLSGEAYTPLAFARGLKANTILHLQVEGETSWQQVVDLLSLTGQQRLAGISLTIADDTPAIPSRGEGHEKDIKREMAP